MIGDDVRQDVHGAMALGMRGVLVQTGKYRRGDEGRIGARRSSFRHRGLQVIPHRVCAIVRPLSFLRRHGLS
jgi:ribonucleotide monophosphatase NagD (HAD superfamily)